MYTSGIEIFFRACLLEVFQIVKPGIKGISEEYYYRQVADDIQAVQIGVAVKSAHSTCFLCSRDEPGTSVTIVRQIMAKMVSLDQICS